MAAIPAVFLLYIGSLYCTNVSATPAASTAGKWVCVHQDSKIDSSFSREEASVESSGSGESNWWWLWDVDEVEDKFKYDKSTWWWLGRRRLLRVRNLLQQPTLPDGEEQEEQEEQEEEEEEKEKRQEEEEEGKEKVVCAEGYTLVWRPAVASYGGLRVQFQDSSTEQASQEQSSEKTQSQEDDTTTNTEPQQGPQGPQQGPQQRPQQGPQQRPQQGYSPPPWLSSDVYSSESDSSAEPAPHVVPYMCRIAFKKEGCEGTIKSMADMQEVGCRKFLDAERSGKRFYNILRGKLWCDTRDCKTCLVKASPVDPLSKICYNNSMLGMKRTDAPGKSWNYIRGHCPKIGRG